METGFFFIISLPGTLLKDLGICAQRKFCTSTFVSGFVRLAVEILADSLWNKLRHLLKTSSCVEGDDCRVAGRFMRQTEKCP